MESLKPGEWNQVAAVEDAGRLDSYLAKTFPELSRSRAQKLIEDDFVKKNGTPARSNAQVMAGDIIEIFFPEPKTLDLRPQEIPLQIYYQDEHVAVVEKPAGLVVHPAAGHEEGTLVNALLHHFDGLSSGSGIGGTLRPGIVHRLDRFTSGILLVTKTDLAHQHLSEQFKVHSITRRYRGLCWGKLQDKGSWDKPLGRDPKERKRMAIVESGKRALTSFARQDLYPGPISLFEAELFTGRTHQIRVHFSAHGHPLVGDGIYTNASRSARQAKEEGMRLLHKRCPTAAEKISALLDQGRQFLHAAHLGFEHPTRKERMEFESELPADLREIMLELERCKKP